MNQVITRIFPKIHCHAKRLMAEDMQHRRERGERVDVKGWISARADEVNMSKFALEHIIYGRQSYEGYQEDLVKIFGNDVLMVQWVKIED